MSRRIYDDETIAKVQQERANGATVMELANKYYVHYRTIENWCKKSTALKVHADFMRRRFVTVS